MIIKKKKGFTLIELMAVIAIVAILAAVLVPTVSGYIERSKKTALITQIRTVVNSIEVFNSTAITGKVEDGDTISKILPINTNKGFEGGKVEFINQEFLSEDDVSKLNVSLTYKQLSTINKDQDAMNGIYKSTTDGENKGKFVYKIGNSEIVLEYVSPDLNN